MSAAGDYDLVMIFVGDRVALLPHLDRWMRGDRYGELSA